MLPRSPPSAAAAPGAMVPGVGDVELAVTLDQVPRWSDPDQRIFPSTSDEASVGAGGSEPPAASDFLSCSDPLAAGGASRFPVDQEINSRIYLWRGHPWNLEVDAVVNSTNESLDEAHSSPGLHAAAGSGLAEECATLGGCRTGMAKMTNAYDLPARRLSILWAPNMLSSITQLPRMHLVIVTGPVWNCSLRMVLKASQWVAYTRKLKTTLANQLLMWQ